MHPLKPIRHFIFLLALSWSWGCKHSSGNRWPATNPLPVLNNPITGSFNSDDDSICVLARNANTINREIAVILPSGNEGILIPFGKPWAGSGSGAPEIGQSYFQVQLLGGMPATQAARSGNWSWVADASKYGGGYYNGTSGSINFTTQSGVTRIGVYDMAVSSSGFFVVEIDGDKTLANHLPSASAMVANGSLPATVLIAQGGTLHPNDKIYYQKSPAGTSLIPASPSGLDNILTQNRRIRIASGLSAGTHTVKFIQSGYTANGSSASNLRLSGIWFDTPAAGIGDPGIGFEIKPVQEMHCPSSDNNFAFRFRPEGFSSASDYEWLGHNNGSQIRSGTGTLRLDGLVYPDLPMGTLRRVHDMVLEVHGLLVHPLTSDPVAEYTQTFFINTQEGIQCQTAITWTHSGHITLGYIPQLAVFGPVNKATVWEATQNYFLDQNNDANRYNDKGSLAYIWSPTSNWALMLQSSIQDTLWLADRSDQYNKIYFRHYNNSLIHAGDTLNVVSNYRFKKIPQADIILSK